LPQMGFRNVYHQTGYEADDLIAWCVARFPDEYIIVSKDNDLFILNKFGQIIPPEQMMCYLKKFDIKSEDQSVAIKECQS